MMTMGVGAEESIGCVISSIGNMGPGLGETGPAYSWNALPDAAKMAVILFNASGSS